MVVRHYEILKLYATGYTPYEIVDVLGVTYSCVDGCIEQHRKRQGFKTRKELRAWIRDILKEMNNEQLLL